MTKNNNNRAKHIAPGMYSDRIFSNKDEKFPSSRISSLEIIEEGNFSSLLENILSGRVHIISRVRRTQPKSKYSGREQ